MSQLPEITPLAETVTRTIFEWERIQSNTDWILPICALAAILLFVRAMYRRDSVEMSAVWGWLLTFLRLAAFLGLLILYLQPHWRSEREEVRNSRVLLLVDTSQSMGMTDADAGTTENRLQQIAKGLRDSDLLARLREVHDVTVLTFDEELKRNQAVTLKKISPQEQSGENKPSSAGENGAKDNGDKSQVNPTAPPDWNKLLAPRGGETRLGQALRQLLQDERGTPISGIVVFTDGGQNAGPGPQSAVEIAREAGIPLFPVGMGSDRLPINVAVSDFAVPARAFPGDRYTATAYIQAQGMSGKSVAVRLYSRPAGEGASDEGQTPLETQEITLGGDGEVLPVKFELKSEETGRRTLTVRVMAPAEDRNAADNFREADVEIVDRKNRIMLLADGPMREFQFLRNQLHREKYTAVDVLLQSAHEGISQEADRILDSFPASAEELAQYDCIVAFDPNWQAIGGQGAKMLEKWVSDQGGGLIVVAGPIHACRGLSGWVNDQSCGPIRNLYPVEFHSRTAAVETEMFTDREPWPLEFTREGLEAEFLWLSDSATASRQAWADFPGVYSVVPVRGPKQGATVYARFSDPRAAQGGQQPVYMAGQFYGAGRVFYLGSGEMWRLRAVDENYFDQFYTKLIRQISQGRLLRGSSRGVLLVGQDRYLLGNTVEVRAQLTDARLEPLHAPSVNVQIVVPDGTVKSLTLKPDPTRAGAFIGQFPAMLEGTYRLELLVPESENERLGRRIQVKAPDLERDNSRRNDPLLSSMAKDTSGRYYIGMNQAVAVSGVPPLTMQLKDRTNTVVIPVAPNPKKEEQWLRWIMLGLCGVMCLEWLIRRLLRLA
jgi:hypothetical protein